ncbi:MAG: class I SAM-dependent RNA methyltransferase [Microbacteriaceae bacterium]|nr:class I SAM-dependent RNA methyltransferase [Microbacteriaceae bacterium]
MTAGAIVDLEIGDVAHGGVLVARHQSGRVVFVADALPGERVRARVADVKKRFARAETLEVLEASPERVDHVWPEASLDRDPDERAGGAEFGHAPVAFGRELKRRVLADALTRFGGLDADSPLVAALAVEGLPGDDADRGRHWRTRVTLHVDADGRVGPYAARSHRVVDVASLPLAFDDIEERALRAIADGVGGGPGRVDFVAPSDHDTRMRVVLDGAPAREPGRIVERVRDREFSVSEAGFWQVHRHAATTLFDAVQQAVDPGLLRADADNLDLYGGVGLLGAALAELGGAGTRLRSVEASADATAHAEANLAEWTGAAATTARVDRFLRGLVRDAGAAERDRLRAATVVLDPPRAGAGREVVDALVELAPAQLVYVACDPVALGRDTGLLRERGYEPVRLRAFDLFPNTHHVEAVAAFVRG